MARRYLSDSVKASRQAVRVLRKAEKLHKVHKKKWVGRMSVCKFCEAMKANRQVEEITRSWATNEEIKRYGKHMIEYTVAIVKRSYYQKTGKKKSGRTLEFRHRGLGFELNYCPECGTNMRGGGSNE